MRAGTSVWSPGVSGPVLCTPRGPETPALWDVSGGPSCLRGFPTVARLPPPAPCPPRAPFGWRRRRSSPRPRPEPVSVVPGLRGGSWCSLCHDHFPPVSTGAKRRKRDPGRESEWGDGLGPQAGRRAALHPTPPTRPWRLGAETLRSGAVSGLVCRAPGSEPALPGAEALRAAVLSPEHLLTPGLQDPLPSPAWAWGSLPEPPSQCTPWNQSKCWTLASLPGRPREGRSGAARPPWTPWTPRACRLRVGAGRKDTAWVGTHSAWTPSTGSGWCRPSPDGLGPHSDSSGTGSPRVRAASLPRVV